MRYVCSLCHGNGYQIWVDSDGDVDKDPCACVQAGMKPVIEVALRGDASQALIEVLPEKRLK